MFFFLFKCVLNGLKINIMDFVLMQKFCLPKKLLNGKKAKAERLNCFLQVINQEGKSLQVT